MKLYSNAISPAGKRVRIAAAELGLAVEEQALDVAKGEQRQPPYLALNPMGKLPTLVDGELVLWESAAIVWYLAAKAGQSATNALSPSETMAQADMLRWMFFGACHLDPHFTALVGERFLKARRQQPEDPTLAGAAERELARFVPVVDGQLAKTEYLTGRFTLADIVCGCTLELAPLLRYDLAPFPHVRRWLERLQARPSWQKAFGA